MHHPTKNVSQIYAKENKIFDSEPNELSQKNKSSDLQNLNPNKTNSKKSINIFSKFFTEEPETETFISKRYTIANKLEIKDLVPHIKPIKIFVVPSKLNLNNKLSKKIRKKYHSCPNSDSEDNEKTVIINKNDNNDNYLNVNSSNDNIFGKKNEDINSFRKKLERAKKKKIPKIFSNNNPNVKNKYNKELNLMDSSASDLYDIDELSNSLIDIKEEKKLQDGDIHSWSILDVLQKKV